MSATQEQTAETIEHVPAEYLEERVRRVLEHAVKGQRDGLKVYESLHNLNEVIGAEYGNRVLHELIQNAHDAHEPGDRGKIAIKLVVQSESKGVLYIANGGRGFRKEDVEAIKNIALSAKEVGEGIGNKGLGFRSIEALTDDVRIYSSASAQKTRRFDGYCFRFAKAREIEDILRSEGIDTDTCGEVARTLPRYLVPRPLKQQPDEVASYARRGYATVIVAPLHTAGAVELAKRQVRALADLDVPFLLFLDRIAEIRLDVEIPNQQSYRRRLRRRRTVIDIVPSLADHRMYEVGVGEDKRFLVVRHEVNKERLQRAVERSIHRVPQLKRWLNWKGQPVVSVAVGLSPDAVTEGRLYNFLPMGEEAASPLLGYLDAPFFADINRRNADLELPLNKTLIEAAAEACAAAALSIVACNPPIPQKAVFDLIAWTGEHAEKLDDALDKAGSSLREAPVIPVIAIEGKQGWACLSEISIWPKGTFSILKPKAVAKQVGASLVSSSELDSARLDRLKELAKRIDLWALSPSGPELAEWSEAFARSLLDRKVAPRIWSQFYEDLSRIFHATDENLEELSGKAILYDRRGKLCQAGGHDGTMGAEVFVRSEAAKGKRTKADVPFPPPNLARHYHLLDKNITFRPETLVEFVEADLIREYDPVEALAGLKSALGANPNEERRKEALLWAFKVWRIERERIREELKDAALHIPTRTGWQPATCATFSASWTQVGQTLENFLVGAAERSSDCQQALGRLLIGFADWPIIQRASKGDWIAFLKFIGVADGFRPTVARMQSNATGAIWNHLLYSGDASEGMDDNWCAEAEHVTFFSHRRTNYQRKGEAWRLPGQIEYEELLEASKEEFCTLAFEHLKAHGAKFFAFEIGRFERDYQRAWDRRELPTPLASFLRSKAWIAANTREGVDFRRANECWATRIRQGGLPRFIDHVSSTVVDFTDDNALADLVFGKNLGLRDWQSQDTAADRLKDLTAVSTGLASNDRPAFRREYKRAWCDIVQAGIPLPTDLSLAVHRCGRLEELSGGSEVPPHVIVTKNAQQFEARVLSSAGHAVLEVGEDTSPDKVADILDETGTFIPRRLDGVDVRLLVDDEPFVPRASDPPLTAFGLSWLPEAALLGHELLGEQLERGIQSATVDRIVRTIRLRRCETITLVVNEEEISPNEPMVSYAFEHKTWPTLILTNALSLDWTTLAQELSRAISRLIDSRLRSLETLLLRIAIGQKAHALDAPSDQALAIALGCDVRIVQDHRNELRTDLGHILHLLTPVVAYFKGVTLASRLRDDADNVGVEFDVASWLREQCTDTEITPKELISACERAPDRSTLRKELDLDYEKFNLVLLGLGESPLSNEDELRRLYDAYRSQMRSAIIERLRRHHAADFHNQLDLSSYVGRKTLAFLSFNSDWILTRETLEMEVVETYVSGLLDRILGEDQTVTLPVLSKLIERNRKSVRDFATNAIPIVSAWCRLNQISLIEPWTSGEPQSVALCLENAGLLDFELVSSDQVPGLCRRVGCWPDGMPETLDNTTLGLKQTEIEKEEKRREQERQRKEIKLRSIKFAGRSLDTGDPSFAHTLQQVAKDCIARDDTWFERSRRRTKLIEFDIAAQSKNSRGYQDGRTGRARGRRHLTDAQRQAMGMTSEWLAFEFLRRHHGELVNETCWVSENRTHFFGGDEGNDAAGYDFRVETPQAEWLYEVKSSLEDTGEFELTANELHVASRASKDGRRRYRILYVPFVFSPERWCVLELPNPMGEATRSRFREVGQGSVRFRFERNLL